MVQVSTATNLLKSHFIMVMMHCSHILALIINGLVQDFTESSLQGYSFPCDLQHKDRGEAHFVGVECVDCYDAVEVSKINGYV